MGPVGTTLATRGGPSGAQHLNVLAISLKTSNSSLIFGDSLRPLKVLGFPKDPPMYVASLIISEMSKKKNRNIFSACIVAFYYFNIL